MAREDLLASTFVQLADSLVDDFDIIDLLTVLADRCVELVDADAAGMALADVASIAILQHEATRETQVLADQLQHALDSRISIEQAKGMISERGQIDMDAAFLSLRSYARGHRQPLTSVATAIVAGTLPLEAVIGTDERDAPR